VGGIVVDQCNFRAADRREWLQILQQSDRDSTALVFVDVPADACAARVRARVDHPTILFGRGDGIVPRLCQELGTAD
jgi:hypothetical protein